MQVQERNKEKSPCMLITGGAGFIGSNFIPYFLKEHPEYQLVNLDKLTYAANPANLSEVKDNPHYQLVEGDICNRSLLEGLFMQHDFRGVIHFAAESHVDNSIARPDLFIKTNIEGTFTVLDVARQHWLDSAARPQPGCENCRFHHISTDEVYGSLGPTGRFTEETRYAPSSPYSASKASADMIVRSFFQTYGLNVVITNCSNNYGPKQHREKLIPTIIRKALAGEKIPIYGDGKNVRDWLYVTDHCRAIDLVFRLGQAGESYNIGGGCEYENLQIAKAICQVLDRVAPEKLALYGIESFGQLIIFVADRPGHDRRYAVDSAKIKRELGWQVGESFIKAIDKTVEWYAAADHKS